MNLVIDASVLIKFYVPEIHSERAEHLLMQVEQGDVILLAPDLIYSESGNTLWKKGRIKELTRSEIDEITDAIISLPLKIEPSKPLLPLAMDMSVVYGITVYDAMYISLARVYETKMMTADGKLLDSLSKTDLKGNIICLRDYI